VIISVVITSKATGDKANGKTKKYLLRRMKVNKFRCLFLGVCEKHSTRSRRKHCASTKGGSSQ